MQMHYLGIICTSSPLCTHRPVSCQQPSQYPFSTFSLCPDQTGHLSTGPNCGVYYFQNGLAASTQRSYNSGKRRYLKFCQIKGSAPVPASEHQLCQFVAFLANENLCHNTIKSYLAAIRHLHIAEGAGDPGMSNMPRLEQVVKGIKVTQVKEGKKVKARLPITPELLRMKQAWSQEQDSRDV